MYVYVYIYLDKIDREITEKYTPLLFDCASYLGLWVNEAESG